jgi:putative peptidoglycan lipid II flippase
MIRGDGKRSITRAAGLMSIATFISRILGYVKDMILAFYFGATGISDSFFAAFRIINFSRELFAEGSMSAAFIPVLTEHRVQKGEEEAKHLVKVTFSFILIVAGIMCALGIIFAPAIVRVIAPGFVLDHPEQVPLTILLTRVMFPFLFFISLAALVMGALNTKKVFFIPALAPAMLNITIIIMIVSFISFFKQQIVVVALGVAIGGFVQFAFQLPSFYKNGYRLGFTPHFRHPGLKKMAILLLPITLALAVSQINILVGTVLASFLPQGSITYLYYSMRLIQFPIGIFGVSMGMAALPMLSEHAVKGDFDKLREDFSFALRLLFYISVPAMAGLIALREPIVNLLFQRGTFDYTATQATAEALMFYSLGIWATGGVRIMSVTFYSMQDTRTPVKINAIGVAANLVLCLILMGPLKHSGIALAYALAFSVNFTLLFIFIRKKLGQIDTRKIFRSFIKTCIAAGIMGIIGGVILRGNLWQFSGNTVNKVFYLSGAIALCVGVYFFLTYLLKSEECLYIIGLVKKKIRQ